LQSSDCITNSKSADDVDQQKQEQLQREGSSEIGMPAIHNFTEKKMVKMLYELRDNPNLINYAYLFSEVSGKYTFFGKCVGYGIPYSTQFSNPEKVEQEYTSSYGTLPQAEPNGLFMPASSDGTWLMMVGPDNKPTPVYVEPKVIVSPFKLSE
ncbi:MAG: hypothetical protein ACTHJ8_10570, partial [Mucilaginibacter sp.]